MSKETVIFKYDYGYERKQFHKFFPWAFRHSFIAVKKKKKFRILTNVFKIKLKVITDLCSRIDISGPVWLNLKIKTIMPSRKEH